MTDERQPEEYGRDDMVCATCGGSVLSHELDLEGVEMWCPEHPNGHVVHRDDLADVCSGCGSLNGNHKMSCHRGDGHGTRITTQL